MDEPKQDGSAGTEPNGSGVRSGVRAATLYRYYGWDGDLLYVGKTGVGQRRGSGHARSSDWWPHAAYAEFFHSDSFTVDVAERLAIWQERPRYNVVLRTSTAARQAMLVRLGPPRAALLQADDAVSILSLTHDELQVAVDLEFLASDRRWRLLFRHDELARFIGEADDLGAITTTPEHDRSFRPRLMRRA